MAKTNAEARKSTAKISDAAVKALTSRAARYIEWYPGGLGVRVALSGRKSFIYWYRQGDRKRLMTLGAYPAMSVATANRLHNEAQCKRMDNVDPAVAARAERKQAQQAEQQAASASTRPTLRVVVAAMAEDKTFLAKASATDTLRRIRKDILEYRLPDEPLPLGDIPLAAVRKRHAVLAIDAVRKRGDRIGDVAAADFVRLGKYAVKKGFLDEDETNRLRDFERARYTPKDRALGIATADDTDDDRTWELVRVLERLPQVGMHPVTVLALLFVLTTGQRPGEVAGMPKRELRQDGSLWVIAPERLKTNWRDKKPMPHYVPLPDLAQHLLAVAGIYNSDSDWVFPSPLDPDKALQPLTLPRAVRRKLGKATPYNTAPAPRTLGVDPFTPHDLRRTCRSWLAALGVRDDIAERVIGHKPGGMVAVYNRHQFLDERRAALQLWANKLSELVPGLTEALAAQRRAA